MRVPTRANKLSARGRSQGVRIKKLDVISQTTFRLSAGSLGTRLCWAGAGHGIPGRVRRAAPSLCLAGLGRHRQKSKKSQKFIDKAQCEHGIQDKTV